MRYLSDFIRASIEGREQLKFVFSKSVSKILQLIEELGKRADISKEDMAFIDISVVKQLYVDLHTGLIGNIFESKASTIVNTVNCVGVMGKGIALEFKKRYPLKADEVDTWDDITFLNKSHFTIKGKITRTALIILGNEESAHLLSPAVCQIRWSLKSSRNENIDYEIFNIPMLLAVDQVRDLRPAFRAVALVYNPFAVIQKSASHITDLHPQ